MHPRSCSLPVLDARHGAWHHVLIAQLGERKTEAFATKALTAILRPRVRFTVKTCLSRAVNWVTTPADTSVQLAAADDTRSRSPLSPWTTDRIFRVSGHSTCEIRLFSALGRTRSRPSMQMPPSFPKHPYRVLDDALGSSPKREISGQPALSP